MNNIEYRVFPGKGIEIREAPKDSGFLGILSGVAAPFNSNSVQFAGFERPWVERIAPGAFARTLRENPDVVALWSHDSNKPLARTPNTLTLTETDAGLSFEMRVADTTTGRDLIANVRAKIVDGVSFAFEQIKTAWAKGDEFDVRTLVDIDLFEISPTVWPAYESTTIAARSAWALRAVRPDSNYLKEIMEERQQFFAKSLVNQPQSQRERLMRIYSR